MALSPRHIAASVDAHHSFAEAVRFGLTQPQKSIPPRFLYDARGSELFEEITKLPEYYLTGAEASILTECAPEIWSAAGYPIEVIELGSGSSAKTRTILEAGLDQSLRLTYRPIDISAEMLESTARQLRHEYPRLQVDSLVGTYESALQTLTAATGPRLFLFLGSSIGNYTDSQAVDLLKSVRHAMGKTDRLLLGTDLRKAAHVIEPAYNDAAGVTAAFNRNLLIRINREFGANFDVAAFCHRAPFLPEPSHVEMRLVSRWNQRVRLPALEIDVDFEPGEWILTEISTKYEPDRVRALAEQAGLQVQEGYLEREGRFAEWLLSPT